MVVCNRFRYDPIDGGKKIMTTLEFQDTICIESKSADHLISNQFQLNAVVRHLGSSSAGGHYIADCLEEASVGTQQQNKVWRRYDDSKVSDITVVSYDIFPHQHTNVTDYVYVLVQSTARTRRIAVHFNVFSN